MEGGGGAQLSQGGGCCATPALRAGCGRCRAPASSRPLHREEVGAQLWVQPAWSRPGAGPLASGWALLGGGHGLEAAKPCRVTVQARRRGALGRVSRGAGACAPGLPLRPPTLTLGVSAWMAATPRARPGPRTPVCSRRAAGTGPFTARMGTGSPFWQRPRRWHPVSWKGDRGAVR